MYALASLNDQIKDVGSFASIALALLVIFTNSRADSLQEWEEGGRRRSAGRAQWTLAFDIALLIATLLLLAALFPLLYDAADELSLGRNRGVLRCLFVLVWFGLAMLAAFQGWIFMDRLKRYKATHGKQ